MGKLIDETGNKYGRLTVIRKSEQKRNTAYWVCECECGNIVEVSGSHLRQGKITSCGCYHKEKASKNEIGNIYGKLTVIAKAPSRNGRAYWVCKCECGNITQVSGTNLRAGQKSCSLSCGLVENKIGKTYGKLTVVQQLHDGLCVCKCECGNSVIVSGRDLSRGHKLSCGCMKSVGESKLVSIFNKLQIQYETQKMFKDCKFKDTDSYARFDFYLPEYNILIEYDGIQHYISKNSGWSNQEQLEYTQSHDEYKNQWCEKNNITLIRIPYFDLEKLNEEYILNLIHEVK